MGHEIVYLFYVTRFQVFLGLLLCDEIPQHNMAVCFFVVFVFVSDYTGFSDGLLLTDPTHVEQRLNQLENQIQGLSQVVNSLKQENTALKAQVSGTFNELNILFGTVYREIFDPVLFLSLLSSLPVSNLRLGEFQCLKLHVSLFKHI